MAASTASARTDGAANRTPLLSVEPRLVSITFCPKQVNCLAQRDQSVLNLLISVTEVTGEVKPPIVTVNGSRMDDNFGRRNPPEVGDAPRYDWVATYDVARFDRMGGHHVSFGYRRQ
jgi:hypothetical protein